MPGKFLRHLQIDFAQGNCWTSARPNDEAAGAVYRQPRPCIDWMYEHFALPLPTQGIVKVLVNLTASATNPVVEVIPHTPEDRPGQGIAYVYQQFDLAHFLTLGEHDQNLDLLEHLHAALTRCAESFNWDSTPFETARQEIIRANFRVSFQAKKAVTSPDRQTKVQRLTEVTHQAEFFLVFRDRELRELRRVLFSIGPPPPGTATADCFDVAWIDSGTVQVRVKGNDHSWTCTTDGKLEFCSPRAAAGDPHAEYQLGRMYLDGTTVLQDPVRGWEWIRSAAAKGYKHAERLIERTGPIEGQP